MLHKSSDKMLTSIIYNKFVLYTIKISSRKSVILRYMHLKLFWSIQISYVKYYYFAGFEPLLNKSVQQIILSL